MSTWIVDLIKLVIGGILGGIITFLRMKWKLTQDRKTEWAKKREPIYAKGLEFIYDVEKNQANPDELGNIIDRWADWFPLNAIYLPPKVLSALHGAMHWTVPVLVDLHNKENDRGTWDIFREKLQVAKTILLESRDIGWLPKDLRL